MNLSPRGELENSPLTREWQAVSRRRRLLITAVLLLSTNLVSVSRTTARRAEAPAPTTPPPVPVSAAAVLTAVTPSPSPAGDAPQVAAGTLRKENVYTVLIVGRDTAGLNTDTIMVARLDCDQKRLDVVSLPRDTLVNVP